MSRFTSRQLLRRATGGRAESFSPESDEGDDTSADFPLEPGTDSPLSSSLSGAPSSDTEFMSGARKKPVRKPASGEAESAVSTDRAERLPFVDDDFLAAARRAARAAADEDSDADQDVSPAKEIGGGRAPRSRKSHGAAIAAVIVVVLALAAAGAVAYTKVWPYQEVIAYLDTLGLTDLSDQGGPTATTAAAPATVGDDTDTMTAAPSASDVASTPASTPSSDATSGSAAHAGKAADDQVSAAPEEPSAVASTAAPSAAPAETPSASGGTPTDTAMTATTTTTTTSECFAIVAAIVAAGGLGRIHTRDAGHPVFRRAV